MNNKCSNKKYLLMPDSFKGTMDAIEVCDIMRTAIYDKDHEADIISVPIADGGEGTVDCFLSAFGGDKKHISVTGPYGKQITSFYGITGDVAVIEMAAASGFSFDSDGMRDPSSATTFGVGELIKDAVENGSRKIILGLGGSCTNDGGVGMAAALGTRFYDRNGREFVPVGKNLCSIEKIDNSKTDKFLSAVSIEVMCDIDNPLYGHNGAAYIFAPQKGADEAMVEMLDRNLKYFADLVNSNLGIDVSCLSGGGAAGGMGAGAYVFLHADMRQGIDVILDMLQFERLLKDCKVIFPGEGQFDRQSLGGKVVVGISKRAKKADVPVIAVVGRMKEDIPELAEVGINHVFQTDPGIYKNKEGLITHCREDLYNAMIKILDGNYIN